MAIGKKTGGGSRKGKPNKQTAALKDMILGALNSGAGGEAWLTQQRRDNPVAFMQLIGKVLPTTLAGDPSAPLAVIGKIELVAVEPTRTDDAS